MIQIFLNGNIEYIKSDTSVQSFLDSIKETLPKVYVVELNMQIINRDDFNLHFLKTGDRLEIVQFCAGG